jgi:hypothetical protein
MMTYADVNADVCAEKNYDNAEEVGKRIKAIQKKLKAAVQLQADAAAGKELNVCAHSLTHAHTHAHKHAHAHTREREREREREELNA